MGEVAATPEVLAREKATPPVAPPPVLLLSAAIKRDCHLLGTAIPQAINAPFFPVTQFSFISG